jgi:hypothetical protein
MIFLRIRQARFIPGMNAGVFSRNSDKTKHKINDGNEEWDC